MKRNRLFALAALGIGLTLTATAQQGSGPGGGQGGPGGGPGWARPTSGQITEIAADHITIKIESGDSLKVVYNANTHVMQRTAPPAGENAGQGGRQRGEGGMRGGAEPIKITDLKVGDAVAVMGQTDAATKSIGAFAIIRVDAETLKKAKEMEANFGKTWLAGKVTAINDTTITISGQLDGKAHSFVVDESTSFSQHRDAITLADIKVGDNLRAQGALKGESFTATKVTDMGDMPQGRRPQGGGPEGNSPAPPQPPANQ